LRPDGWDVLPESAADLPNTESPQWRREGLRSRMTWQPVEDSAAAALSPQAKDEEEEDPVEAAATELVNILGPQRFALARYCVQREIALGEGRAAGVLPAEQLFVLQAVARYHDVHAKCGKFLPLLRAALSSLPVARGPCYRAIAASQTNSVANLLSDYRSGSMVSWPTGTAATLDFGLAMQLLQTPVGGSAPSMVGAPVASGVIFKVRRNLTAREVSPEGKEVLFLGGPLRVAGLFALSGPMLTSEHAIAALSNPLNDGMERLGPWCAPLDLARRPRPLDEADASREPLLLVLLDEEEEETNAAVP